MEIFKGDGYIDFGHRLEGHEVKVSYPSLVWAQCLKNEWDDIASENPHAKVTINWIDSPTKDANGPMITGKFRVYDGNLYK